MWMPGRACEPPSRAEGKASHAQESLTSGSGTLSGGPGRRGTWPPPGCGHLPSGGPPCRSAIGEALGNRSEMETERQGACWVGGRGASGGSWREKGQSGVTCIGPHPAQTSLGGVLRRGGSVACDRGQPCGSCQRGPCAEHPSRAARPSLEACVSCLPRPPSSCPLGQLTHPQPHRHLQEQKI